MDTEKQRVSEHHFKQDAMIAAAAIILLLIFFLDKKFNDSRIFGTFLNRSSGIGETTK
jgi:Ca2+/Na+ antiporter